MKDNLAAIRADLLPAQDLIVREFVLGWTGAPRAGLLYLDGLADTDFLQRDVLKPLTLSGDRLAENQLRGRGDLLGQLEEKLLPIAQVRRSSDRRELRQAILEGDGALLIEGCSQGLILGVRGYDTRAISEPTTEGVVRGPRDGFTEEIKTNLSLIRRRLPSRQLAVEFLQLGDYTRTRVALVYMKELARPGLVEEVRRRLAAIRIDGILESGYIEEFIEDNSWSIYPQLERTERPDKVTAGLLEGRVAIVTQNTPFVLLLPTVVFQFLHSPEDYYERPFIAAALRLMRLANLIVSLLGPSLYVAVLSYHQAMLPSPLDLTISAARQGVPFPVFVEAFAMEFTFEVLREAGVRLPRPIGQAVSIVGALVIGDSAVRAGLVSPITVIVVAVTGIANFTLPGFGGATAIRLLRFLSIILAGLLGLFGVIALLALVIFHLASLESFGVPYLAPLAPLNLKDLKDIFFRAPWWTMKKRPGIFAPKTAPPGERQR
ncbi:MAG: spore germination protein [Firmicutes bacterium]|nr:spore germination protein [Bacillota bacterium]